MWKLLVLVMVLALAGSAVAFDSGNERPAKPEVNYPVDVPDGDRQGGDTIADAVPITIPYRGTGTTAGYTDDYDEVCPYSTPGSPEVVYTTIPDFDRTWDIDHWFWLVEYGEITEVQ